MRSVAKSHFASRECLRAAKRDPPVETSAVANGVGLPRFVARSVPQRVDLLVDLCYYSVLGRTVKGRNMQFALSILLEPGRLMGELLKLVLDVSAALNFIKPN